MTRVDLERFILAESAIAWAALIEMDRERGGTGQLHDTAISLVENRTKVAIHCNYTDDANTLTAWFKLPEPLPPDDDIVLGEVVGDWQRYSGGFLARLHDWLQRKRPDEPKLSEPCPAGTALH